MPPKNSFSELFLSHDGLMTPVLTRHLGRISAKPRSHFDLGDRLVRESHLLQTKTQKSVLDARLEIFTPSLPNQLLSGLRETAIPFGQLLLDLGLKVQTSGRTFYRQAMTDRWGRRLAILDKATGKTLCNVDELLVKEADLAALMA